MSVQTDSCCGGQRIVIWTLWWMCATATASHILICICITNQFTLPIRKQWWILTSMNSNSLLFKDRYKKVCGVKTSFCCKQNSTIKFNRKWNRSFTVMDQVNEPLTLVLMFICERFVCFYIVLMVPNFSEYGCVHDL